MKEKIKGIVDNNLSVLVIYACLVAVIFAGIISKGSTYLSGYDNLTQTYAWLYKQWAAIHNHEIALWDFQPEEVLLLENCRPHHFIHSILSFPLLCRIFRSIV